MKRRQQTTANATGLMAAAMMFAAGCQFARNIILARILEPEDFGVGATFALTLTLMEMITNLGPQKQLIQARDGHEARWHAVAHTILILRGLLLSSLIFLMAPFVAGWFKIPEATTVFRCLALIPIIRGFEHCDTYRFQRDLLMGRLATIRSVPPVIGLLAAPLLAYYFQDYRAFLVVTLLIAFSTTLLSHILSDRPYRIGFSKDVLIRFLSFGWPLLGNGVLLFLVFHGERALIGTFYDLAILGAYSVVLTLAMRPTTTLASLHGSIALPLFSRAKDDRSLFHAHFERSSQVMCLSAGVVAVILMTAGTWLIENIYGARYLAAAEAIMWIGFTCSMRIARTSVAMASIAVGDTTNALIANLCRAASFGVAFIFASRGAGVAWVAICAFVGESCAYLISAAILRFRHQIRSERHLFCVLPVCAFCLLIKLLSLNGWAFNVSEPASAVCCLLLLFAFCLLIWNELRTLLVRLFVPRIRGGLTR